MNAVLSVLQICLVDIEYSMISILHSKCSGFGDSWANLKVVVEPESESVHVGKEYKAKIFPAVVDCTAVPVIILNERQLPIKHGQGTYREKAEKSGHFIRNGYVGLIIPSGEIKKYSFKLEFEVE
jgi:hypothetical protein